MSLLRYLITDPISSTITGMKMLLMIMVLTRVSPVYAYHCIPKSVLEPLKKSVPPSPCSLKFAVAKSIRTPVFKNWRMNTDDAMLDDLPE